MSNRHHEEEKSGLKIYFIKKFFSGVEQLIQLLAEAEDVETRKQIHRSLRRVLRRLKMTMIKQAEDAGKD